MARVVIVGDGPGGLSAALFLAKNGQQVTVFGTDRTAMHYAYLYNYLGIPEIAGSELQRIAKEQVSSFGARLMEATVEKVEVGAAGFTVTTSQGVEQADYLILSEGKDPTLARSLGLAESEGGGIAVDADYLSSQERVYVVGRAARPHSSQAIISAGAGAAAALHILALEAGKPVQDWDTPPKE